MDCHEAQRRLTGSPRDGSDPNADRELQEHLAQCPKCAEYARAAGTLRQVLTSAAANDDLDVTAIEAQRTLVEARARQQRTARHGVIAVLKARPVMGLSIVAVAAVFLVMAVVPFSYYQTVGYEVAVDGVESELVETNDHICDMLFDLGLHDADVELLGCEHTCALTIYHLKSESEAQLVAAVFNRINPTQITADVKPVKARTSATLLDRSGLI